MTLGLLYDVHGNLPALEAVLDDAREVGVERWVVGGDVAALGAWPVECVARLHELAGATWVRGNWERWVARGGADVPEAVASAVPAYRDALGAELVEELAALPETIALGDTLFAHASPVNDMDSFLPEPGEDEERLLAPARADVRRVVFGHTHLQFRRPARGRENVELVNPGSVGMPFDGDLRAAWTTVGDDGSLTLRRAAYDVERSAAAVEARFVGDAWARGVAARLRTARFEP